MRTFAALGVVVSCFVVLFFFAAFDVGVDTGYGRRVANLDKMNTRTNGIIVGIAMGLGSLMILLFHKGPRKSTPKPMSPPQAPSGFAFQLPDALSYPITGPTNTQKSIIQWKKELEAHIGNIASTYQPRQLEFGWHYGLSPQDFVNTVRYIEDYRLYQHHSNCVRA